MNRTWDGFEDIFGSCDEKASEFLEFYLASLSWDTILFPLLKAIPKSILPITLGVFIDFLILGN